MTYLDKKKIKMGTYVNKYGVKTKRPVSFPIEKIQSHVLISGVWRIGGSQLLARIGNQLYDAFPEVGVLNVNQFSKIRKNRYLYHAIFNHKSKDLKIPYFIEGQDRETSLRQTITYLGASLGFTDRLTSIWLDAVQDTELPKRLSALLYNLYDYLIDYKINIGCEIILFPAIANIIKGSSTEKILELSSDVPDLFNAWSNGEKIFLDIAGLPNLEKLIITNALYQMIRTLTTEEAPHKRPKGIILVEEANYALLNQNFLHIPSSRKEIEQVFDEIMQDFERKGIYFIIEDDQPQRFFPCVLSNTPLKILFRLGYIQSKSLHLPKGALECLERLPNRQALVLNRLTGERFVFSL